MAYGSSLVWTTNSLKRGAAANRTFAVLRELTCGVSRFRQILLRQFLQPDFAVHRHEDVDHQCDQSLIGADIRGRFLAADVLLARGQRKHESALALLVDGLADQAARHLADVFFARRNDAAVGAAEAQRHAERLGFHGDDVSLRAVARRFRARPLPRSKPPASPRACGRFHRLPRRLQSCRKN